MTLPTGPAVTFLFTDIEGSTRSSAPPGSARWAALVARHEAILREALVLFRFGDAEAAARDHGSRV